MPENHARVAQVDVQLDATANLAEWLPRNIVTRLQQAALSAWVAARQWVNCYDLFLAQRNPFQLRRAAVGISWLRHAAPQ